MKGEWWMIQGGRKQIQSGEANISQENLIDIYK